MVHSNYNEHQPGEQNEIQPSVSGEDDTNYPCADADEEQPRPTPRFSTYFLAPSPKRRQKEQEQREKEEAEGYSCRTSANRVDMDYLKNACFFLFPDRNRRLSRFWILMVLATIIATCGVAGDSAATVIGAMSERTTVSIISHAM